MPSVLSAALLALALFIATFAVNLQAPLYGAYAATSGVGATAVAVAFAAYVAGLMPTLLLLGGLFGSDRPSPTYCYSLVSGERGDRAAVLDA